jgi:hypothetical protein
MTEGKLEFITQENKYDILVEAIVNEVYVDLYFNQYFKYTGNSLGEFSLSLYKIEDVQFVDLEFEAEDKKIKSKLITKKNDQSEIYTDSMASGNTTLYIKDDKESNKYIIEMGNINPGQTIFLKYHFIQKLKSDELNYIYELFLNFPGINNNTYPRSLKANIKFETFNTLTKLEPKIYLENPKITYKFNSDRNMEAEILIKNIDYSIYPMMSFEFQTKDFEIPKLFSQYDPINDETSFLLRNVAKKENIKSPPGYYYFLFNENTKNLQSNDVKKILEIFLNLLPKDSYYQIIGLGNYMKFYNIKPLQYSPTSYQRIINKINMENNSDPNNNQDVINMDEVFEYIYSSGENNKMPKYVFILNSCYSTGVNMMEKYKIYMNKFQIYELQFCIKDMKLSSLTQNGITSFYHYYGEEQLKEIIKKLMVYISNYYSSVNYDIINNKSNEVLYDFKSDNYLIENQIKNYYFIMKGKVNGKIDISNKFTLNNDNYETKLSFNDKSIENIKEGNHLAKIIINKIIQNNKNDNDKKSKLLLSKKYQILNEYTSLFCKIKIQENISENTNHTSLFNNIFNTNNNNNQTSSLFGALKLNTYHSLFENFNPNTNRANNQTGVLFGATNNMYLNQSQPGGLFGNTRNSTLNTTSSLFGNNDNI